MTFRGVNQQRYDAPWPGQTWFWRQVGQLGQDKLPFRQQDWPNPQVPKWIDETWVWRQVGMLGLDKLPTRQQNWPNPTTVLWYQNWTVNLLQNTLTPAPQIPKNQFNWPNPTPVLWNNGQTSWYTLSLIGKDTLPKNQKDWPNPTPVSWSQPWQFTYNLYGQDKLPNRQQDWPNPQPVQWYQDHRVNLLQTTLFSSPQPLPLNQYSWPTPVGYEYRYGSTFSLLPLITPPPPPVGPIGGGRQLGPGPEAAYDEKLYEYARYREGLEQLYKHMAAVKLGKAGGIKSGQARKHK